MKKSTKLIIVFVLLVVFLLFVIPIIINELFKINDGYLTVWSGADVLSFYGAALSAIGAIVLGIVAWKQNERLVKLEEDKLLSENACPILIDGIFIEKLNTVACNLDYHDEQIVCTKKADYSERYPSPSIVFKAKYLENKPSYVHIDRIKLLIDHGKRKRLIFDASSKSIDYTRVAISEKHSVFTATVIMSEEEKADILKTISSSRSGIIIDADLSVLSAGFVASNVHCRTSLMCFDYDKDEKNYCRLKSREFLSPIYFWHGNEFVKKENIIIKDDVKYEMYDEQVDEK